MRERERENYICMRNGTFRHVPYLPCLSLSLSRLFQSELEFNSKQSGRSGYRGSYRERTENYFTIKISVINLARCRLDQPL